MNLQKLLAIDAWAYVFVLPFLILRGELPKELFGSAWITFFVFFVIAFFASIYKERNPPK